MGLKVKRGLVKRVPCLGGEDALPVMSDDG